ncbi:MAG: tyrosine recombinase [Ruminococcaceae bacterium]|nr:tyrosine recombinase [Oscillospiraceae bacterium]
MFDLLQEYKEYLSNNGVSKSTYDAYVRDVTSFLSYVDISVSHNIEDVKPEDIEGFKKALEKYGKTPATINRCFASVKSFYRFLKISGISMHDPALNLCKVKQQRKMPTILSGKEVDRLLRIPDISTPKGCRDKAMLELLYATGMRVSELIELDLDDIQLNKSIVCCHSGNIIRTIPIYSAAKNAVRDYLLRVYPYYSKSDNNALFINMNGSRLTRQGFWKIVKFYAEELSLNTEITPHTLRHSFAAHLIENGARVEDVKEMLGHADIASTQIYAQIVNNRFKDTYTRCHPRAKSV